jgi:deazaflavin-dependent oxidoreductase (nitroreductase family)
MMTDTSSSSLSPLPPLAPTPPRSLWFTRLHVWLYRVSRGRIAGKLPMRGFLMLTTTGRKTGARYAVPLEYHTDGQIPYIIASNFGKDYPPAWYFNLLANPTVEIERDGQRAWARASVADPAERGRIWATLVRVSPYYARYQRGVSRQIPIVLLHPVHAERPERP